MSVDTLRRLHLVHIPRAATVLCTLIIASGGGVTHTQASRPTHLLASDPLDEVLQRAVAVARAALTTLLVLNSGHNHGRVIYTWLEEECE